MWRRRLSSARKKAAGVLQRQEAPAHAEVAGGRQRAHPRGHLHGAGARPRPRLRALQAEQSRAARESGGAGRQRIPGPRQAACKEQDAAEEAAQGATVRRAEAEQPRAGEPPGRGRARHPGLEDLPHPRGAVSQPQAAILVAVQLDRRAV